jgi:carbonic anhydrase
MRELPQLFRNNRKWASARTDQDPMFFARLCAIQSPKYLWIGCADSRVPANEIVGLAPGELFVHRNVANVVPAYDVNVLSVLQYAIDTLQVQHIIVCGHYGCGGVIAALADVHPPDPLGTWIGYVQRIRHEHRAELDVLVTEEARIKRLCELNVIAQVRSVCGTDTVQGAWKRGQNVVVHGWIYDLHDGLLRDLNVTSSAAADGETKRH